MSTNYYIEDPDVPDGIGMHLGSRAAGWVFMGYAPEGVDSFDDWTAQFADRKVIDEYGELYSPEEFINTVLATVRPNVLRSIMEHGDFTDRGITFHRRRFC